MTIETAIPYSFKWMVTDANGEIYVFAKNPKPVDGVWECLSGGYIQIGKGPKPIDYSKTKIRLIRPRENDNISDYFDKTMKTNV